LVEFIHDDPLIAMDMVKDEELVPIN